MSVEPTHKPVIDPYMEISLFTVPVEEGTGLAKGNVTIKINSMLGVKSSCHIVL